MSRCASMLGRRDALLFAPGVIMLAGLPLDIAGQHWLASSVMGLGTLLALLLYFALAWGRVLEIVNTDRIRTSVLMSGAASTMGHGVAGGSRSSPTPPPSLFSTAERRKR